MATSAASVARLTAGGQVFLPKGVRARLGWSPGTVLQVVMRRNGDAVTLRRPLALRSSRWLDDVAGLVKAGDPVGDLEAEHRLEVAGDANRRS